LSALGLPPSFRGGGGIPVSLVWSHCSFKCDFDFDQHRLKKNVFLEIERRINTGEYKQGLKKLIRSTTLNE